MKYTLEEIGINNTWNIPHNANMSTNILCLDVLITLSIYSIYFMFDQVHTSVKTVLLAWATAGRT